MPVSFIPSQLATLSQTPLPYTANPRELLISDTILLVKNLKYLPGIFLPLRFGSKASRWDELWPSPVNIKSLVLQIITSVSQIVFLITLPLGILFPSLWSIAWIAGFLGCNSLIVKLLNGNSLRLEPSPWVKKQLAARGGKSFEDEYWIFINGVAVGRDWLQSNIDRLSLTFNREVHGVLNSTDGVVFDLVQCLVQRSFAFATDDIRDAYVSIKKALFEQHVNKVVFILHSQGAIEGGLICDWLLAEVPQDNLRRLEVYTFGNAANHFNNPQLATVQHHKPVEAIKSTSYRKVPPRVIGHIEHYANEGDFVAHFGVLNSVMAGQKARNRFMGRVFISPGSGHLLNQHYLHSMFTLDENNMCLDNNEFVDAEVDVHVIDKDDVVEQEDDEREDAYESVTCRSADVTFVGDAGSPAVPTPVNSSIGSLEPSNQHAHRTKKIKVKDLSRLWLYRNGGQPGDSKIERAGTI